ncbi:hypothetical protein DQ04_00211020 [Trypanosoma grayi]|uniref:hypothetical protein n=1 Tax=Trypanosoma grayi TaxID=71804 RepID=UPI0004F40CB1|nr:hypothetical protein DQ04_00211020 [Trypanosoma grayi]KEG15019.1 hypothetical protein DQ04_00211020 [Trypanosoma grayi]
MEKDRLAPSLENTFRCDGGHYEEVKALWTKLALQRRGHVNGTSGLPDVPPISRATLQQWKQYLLFCRWAVARQLDWREVFSYLDDAPEAAGLSSPASHYVTSSIVTPPNKVFPGDECSYKDISVKRTSLVQGNRCQANTFTMRDLVSNYTKRFGTYPLRLHQQRLLRWTNMLTQCIAWRLSDASVKGVCVPKRELQWYRLIFAARAREVAGAAFPLRALLALLEAEENKETCASSQTERGRLGSLPLAETTVLNLTLTISFSPSPFAGGSLAQYVPALAVRSLEALWADQLQIPWDMVDPKSMPEKVRQNLVASLNGEEDSNNVLPAPRNADFKLHCATLKALIEGVDDADGMKTKNPFLGQMFAAPTPLQMASLHQLPILTRVLETAGYVLLTKIRCFCIEKSYYVLPFLADFLAAAIQVKKALSPYPEAPSGSPVASSAMIEMLLQAIMKSIECLYARHVDNCLSKYVKKMSKRVFEVRGSAATVAVSQPMFYLLESVVEPTFEVLLLLSQNDSLGEDQGFACFIIRTLKAVLGAKMDEVEKSSKTGSRAQPQCCADRKVLMNYIDAHPFSLQLRAAVL